VNVLEKEIEKHLVNLVKKSGGLSYKWISTVTGVPDRIVFLNGTCSLVELKTETGRLSPRQELVFDDIGEQGFPVHILHSKEDVEDFINEAMRKV
jgi:VRR-NUC domain